MNILSSNFFSSLMIRILLIYIWYFWWLVPLLPLATSTLLSYQNIEEESGEEFIEIARVLWSECFCQSFILEPQHPDCVTHYLRDLQEGGCVSHESSNNSISPICAKIKIQGNASEIKMYECVIKMYLLCRAFWSWKAKYKQIFSFF